MCLFDATEFFDRHKSPNPSTTHGGHMRTSGNYYTIFNISRGFFRKPCIVYVEVQDSCSEHAHCECVEQKLAGLVAHLKKFGPVSAQLEAGMLDIYISTLDAVTGFEAAKVQVRARRGCSFKTEAAIYRITWSYLMCQSHGVDTTEEVTA